MPAALRYWDMEIGLDKQRLRFLGESYFDDVSAGVRYFLARCVLPSADSNEPDTRAAFWIPKRTTGYTETGIIRSFWCSVEDIYVHGGSAPKIGHVQVALLHQAAYRFCVCSRTDRSLR